MKEQRQYPPGQGWKNRFTLDVLLGRYVAHVPCCNHGRGVGRKVGGEGGEGGEKKEEGKG